jgi:hypothetical protein
MQNFEKRVVEIERQYKDALALYNLVRSQRNKFASFVTVSSLLELVHGLLFKNNLYQWLLSAALHLEVGPIHCVRGLKSSLVTGQKG